MSAVSSTTQPISPLHPLSDNTNTSPNELSLCQRIKNAYVSAIKNFVEFLRRHDWDVTAMVLGTLLVEPWASIKAAFLSITNFKGHYNFYDMNPQEAKEKDPILLIHGNYHNQSAWLSLAKELKQKDIGPVYTVNLPCGRVTKKDYRILQNKIEQIKTLYNRKVKIHVVGHSRGGYLASEIACTILKENGKYYWKTSDTIGKIIKIGSVLDQEDIDNVSSWDSNFCDRVYEITGNNDVLVTEQSILPPNHQLKVDTGHLGLLYAQETHQQVIRWLSHP